MRIPRIAALFCLLLLASFTAFGQIVTYPLVSAQQQFFGNDGKPLAGGKLFSFAAGTSTPLATYSDALGASPNANPVILDSAGRASVFLGTAAYKLTLQTSAGVQLWSQDNVTVASAANLVSKLTVSGNVSVGGTLGVTGNSNLTGISSSLFSRDCRQDGTLDTTGVTDASTVINSCIANAVTNNQAIVELPCGQFKVSTALNLTNKSSMTFRGCGSNITGFNNPNTNMTTLNCNTGAVCVDMVGSSHMRVEELSLRIANAYATPSTVGFLQGRDNALGGGAGAYCFSQFNLFDHVDVLTDFNTVPNSGRGYIGFYNIGAEHQIYKSGKVNAVNPFFFATANVLGVTSSYQTIQTGCSASMTGVLFQDMSLTNNGWSAIETWTSGQFQFDFTEINFTANDTGRFAVQATATCASMVNWSGHLHVENMPTGNGIVSLGCTITDKLNLSIDVGGSVGTSPYIQFAANSLTVTDSDVKINTLNESPAQQFFGNAATGITWKGGRLNLGGSASPSSASNVTLTGTQVQAAGFTDANVTFATGSQYFLTDDTGASFVGGPLKVTGNVGVGVAAVTTAGITVKNSNLTSNFQQGVQSFPVTSSTSQGLGIDTRADVAASVTQGVNAGVAIETPTINAGGVITEWDGIRISPAPTAGTQCAIKLFGSTSGSACFNPPATGGVSSTLPSTAGTLTVTIGSGTAALGTGAIASNTCAATVTVSASSTATTDAISWSFNADPNAVTGYGAGATGTLSVWAFPTANNVNFRVCNLTAGSITPGAATLNWRVVR